MDGRENRELVENGGGVRLGRGGPGCMKQTSRYEVMRYVTGSIECQAIYRSLGKAAPGDEKRQ